MNEPVIKNMIYKEAKECVDKINANMNDVRHLILELYEREGWSALGYPSWRECVTKEFNHCERYLYKQLEAAQTQKQICPIGQKEEIPESQLRPLTKLRDNPAQQREAWQKAVDTAPDGKVTAAHVCKIVKEMEERDGVVATLRSNLDNHVSKIVKEMTKPAQKPNEPIINQELVSREFQVAYDQMVIELRNARAMKWQDTSHKAAMDMMQILLTLSQQIGR